MSGTVNKYLQLLKQNIDRKSLVIIACKLKIAGCTNHFNRPYIKKNTLKVIILDALKNREKNIKRSKSVSSLGTYKKLDKYKKTQGRRKSTGSVNFKKLSDFSPSNYVINKDNTIYIPQVHRIVAIGDIHGDFRAIIRSLKIAGVIPLNTPENNKVDVNKIRWTGGKTVVVQLGDQIDRVRPTNWYNGCVDEHIPNDEGSDLKIINLLDNLNIKARKVGGAVVSIFGNHELMNVDGDFRYVSLNEFEEFGKSLSNSNKTNCDPDYPFGHKERKIAFAPGGILATRLANTRCGIAQVGSWVFVHGGITPKLALKYNIDHINYFTREWLKGNTSPQVLGAIGEIFHSDDEDFSPYWSRVYSDHDDWNENRIKYLFNSTLNILNHPQNRNNRLPIKGMIVGHSPQYMWNKGINSSFDNRLWRVDIGMSRAFGPLNKNRNCRKIQVLEIIDDNKFSILTER